MQKIRALARQRRRVAATGAGSTAINRYIKFSLENDKLGRQLSAADLAKARRLLARARKAKKT